MSSEYWIEGKFPGSKRVLGIGPRMAYFTTLTIVQDSEGWIGLLETKGKKPGKLVIGNDKKGKPFKTEDDLKDYLGRYHLTYLRDKTDAAVETS
jgi:hypothetical protein